MLTMGASYSLVNGRTPSRNSASESDSDIDAYGGSRRAAAKKQHRRLQQPTRDSTPAHGEVRFSTRKAARVSNYNEDDEEPLDEEPQSWIYVDENASPAIDVVLNHRLRDGSGEDVIDPGKDDFEYFIKWQNKAHFHATWETNAALKDSRGSRKLDNYFRKIVLEDVRMRQDKNVPLEERESWNLDRERDTDALNDYVKVERVIGMRIGEEGDTEYLIKCEWAPDLLSPLLIPL